MASFDNEILDLTGADSGMVDRWVDFVADTGDGWGPTMSVFYAATRPTLTPVGGTETQRGSVLVLGGDLVYPTASTRDYEDRLTGPMRSNWAWTEGAPPTVLAVPGNHDWYDGLASFLRVFCRQGWLGAWRTVQSRSYFAAQLPGGWWLWGIDVQLGGYVDRAQLEWFTTVAERLDPGAPLILCTAQPTWVHTRWGEGDIDAYVTTDYFIRKTAGAAGANVRLALAGDLHHYARYESPSGVQLITAGTGGAFLHGTRGLPEQLPIPPEESRDPNRSPTADFTLRASYPDADTSRRLARGIVRLPFRNGGLPVLVGGLYVGLAALLGVASEPLQTPGAVIGRYVRSPMGVFLSALLVLALRKLTKSERSVLAWSLGVGHAATHLVAALTLAGLAGWGLADLLGGDALEVAVGGLGLVVAVGGVGGVVGAWILALWLWLGWRLFRLNNNELFSADRIEDYKGFIRLHITQDGQLTVYPIMLDRTCRASRWRLRERPSGGGADEPWFDPGTPLEARLVDGPITISTGRTAP